MKSDRSINEKFDSLEMMVKEVYVRFLPISELMEQIISEQHARIDELPIFLRRHR